MVPEKLLQDFVERLKSAAGTNLVSVVLYGSALSPDYHPEYSDLNILCVLQELSAQALAAMSPAAEWWTGRKNPMPLFFSKDELLTGADIFPIELLDMQRRHRLLHGDDLLKGLEVPLTQHRIQVEHDLRTNLLRLRQHYLVTRGKSGKVRDLMLESVTSFLTLFRHAVIVMGGPPPASRREAVQQMGSKLGFDPATFVLLMDARAGKADSKSIDVEGVFAKYLQGILAVVQAVDALGQKR
jgi:hypothetical protein